MEKSNFNLVSTKNAVNETFLSDILFTIFFIVFLFQDIFQRWVPLLKNYDEFFSLLFLVIGIILLLMKSSIDKTIIKITIPFSIFILICFIGTLKFNEQSLSVVLTDFLLNSKMFFCIFGAYEFFSTKKDFLKKKYYSIFFSFITVILFTFTFVNFFNNIFNSSYEGVKLMFSHQTYFVSSIVLLIALSVANNKVHKFYIFLDLIMLVMSLKIKAFCFVALFIVYYTYLKTNFLKNKKLLFIIIGSLLVFFIAADRAKFFYFSDMVNARDYLLEYSFVNAKNFFPFGSGFASFASYSSGVQYSSLYYQYGLNMVYGLYPNNPIFMSDTFWPMIIGQGGFLGGIIWVIYLLILIKICYSLDAYKYPALILLFYMIIASTSESSFVNLYCVPYGIAIGAFIGLNKNYDNQY